VRDHIQHVPLRRGRYPSRPAGRAETAHRFEHPGLVSEANSSATMPSTSEPCTVDGVRPVREVVPVGNYAGTTSGCVDGRPRFGVRFATGSPPPRARPHTAVARTPPGPSGPRSTAGPACGARSASTATGSWPRSGAGTSGSLACQGPPPGCDRHARPPGAGGGLPVSLQRPSVKARTVEGAAPARRSVSPSVPPAGRPVSEDEPSPTG
jgi:hypothetical protein